MGPDHMGFPRQTTLAIKTREHFHNQQATFLQAWHDFDKMCRISFTATKTFIGREMSSGVARLPGVPALSTPSTALDQHVAIMTNRCRYHIGALPQTFMIPLFHKAKRCCSNR